MWGVLLLALGGIFPLFKHSCIISPALQTYELLFLAVAYFLYAYARPYKATIVNIIELTLLAYLGLFLILSRGQQVQTTYNIELDEPSFDSCGNKVPSISPAEIVLGVFYFLPLTVLLFFLGRWLFRVGQKCWYDMCVYAYMYHVLYTLLLACCVCMCV